MTKIAFIDASAQDKAFFEEKLSDHELEFVTSDRWRTINPQVEVLSVFVDFNVTRDIIDVLPDLKMITCRSSGYNNIDLVAAKERGIIVANTPGYGASSVAEYAMTLLLMLSRRMISTISSSSDGNEDRNIERGFDLNGKTMGIMGLGAIGKGLAKFANGAGMRVIGYDPFWNDEWANANNVAQVDVDTIFKESDVVSLHVPYLPENHHIVNDERLSQMKQGAVLINTARGELVDTIALLKHVTSSHLGGVGADVIEEEDILVNDNLTQLILNSDSNDDKTAARLKIVSAIAALQKMPNVIITNHNAFNTKEALQLINDMTLENITGFITGGKIYSVK